MARLAVLTAPDGPALPSSFELLPHTVRALALAPGEVRGLDDDLVVVDARTGLARARDLCLELATAPEPRPVLLLVSAQALAVVSAEWGMGDFVLDQAEPGELDARIRLLLATRVAAASAIQSGPVAIDEDGYTATVDGRQLELTYTEFELLKYLVLHPGRVLTREHLLSEVWGYDYYGGTRTVDVHIRRLRAKLGSEYDGHITTVRNVGYRFSASR